MPSYNEETLKFVEVNGLPPFIYIFSNREFGCFKKNMLGRDGKPLPKYLESDDIERYEHKEEKMQIPISGKNGDYVI